MNVVLRYRAYPDADTASEAWRHIDIHRQIRNHAVRDYYSYPEGSRPTKNQQVNELPGWKRQWPLWKEVSAHAAQQTVRQIHTDMDNLGKRAAKGYDVGRLKWQGAGEFRSVAYQSEGYNVNHTTGQRFGTLTLSKIGTMKIRAHREFPSTEDVSRVVLKKERTGEWFACFVIERDEPDKPDAANIDAENCIGIDLGILSYIHTSDDLSVGWLDLDTEYERYAREQRSLDRKEHGSARWEHQREKVAKAKRTIKRKVLDFQHKLSTWLVKNHDAVFTEDLDVKPMLEDSQNAKNKQDAAWSRFLDLCEYKADLYGTVFERVEARGTTKECNRCGVETSKPIWVREHSCPACGYTADRDLNAAKNVFSRGMKKAEIGAGRSDSTPVETALPASTDGGHGSCHSTVSVDAKRVIEAGSPVSPDTG